MVSALDSRSSGLSKSPGRGTVLCSWERHFTLTVTLFTQAYKWVPANLLLRVTLRWTTILDKTVETIGQVTTNLGTTDQFFNPFLPISMLPILSCCTNKAWLTANLIKQHCVWGEGDEILVNRLQVKKLAKNALNTFVSTSFVQDCSISSRASRNAPSCFMLRKLG